MEVQIFSDMVCPFCYIGLKEFFDAVKEGGWNGKIRIVHRAFQLDPNAPKDSDEANEVVIARKYNRSVEDILLSQQKIAERAHLLGLAFRSELIRSANTANAHRVSKYAKIEGKETEWISATMQAFFAQGARLNNMQELLNIAKTVGLDLHETQKIIESDAYTKEIIEDASLAKTYQIGGVPFFVFNQEESIYGAQSKDFFLAALNKIDT